jgi:hypothetical protein
MVRWAWPSTDGHLIMLSRQAFQMSTVGYVIPRSGARHDHTVTAPDTTSTSPVLVPRRSARRLLAAA